MEIGDYFNVWFEDDLENTTIGIVRVDKMSNNTLIDGPVLTTDGITVNWWKIPKDKKGQSFRALETIVSDYKKVAIENLKKKIEAVEKF